MLNWYDDYWILAGINNISNVIIKSLTIQKNGSILLALVDQEMEREISFPVSQSKLSLI
jgi:hypothetical protein